MNKTSIEWTDYSSNLIKYRDYEDATVHDCIKVSAGCANCYASAISKRFSGGEFTATAISGESGVGVITRWLRVAAMGGAITREEIRALEDLGEGAPMEQGRPS